MHPFEGDVVETPLPSAPLAKVLCQVRFPQLMEPRTAANAALSELRQIYPVVREKKETVIGLSPEGPVSMAGEKTLWTASDIEGTWQVTLSDQFFAIETSRYLSRSDFIERLRRVMEIVVERFDVPIYDRIGVRYINRIADPKDLAELNDLVKPVALGALLLPAGPAQMVHSLSDSVFIEGDASIKARWGWLPGGASIDPTLEPPTTDYWLLDIDVSSTHEGKFSAEEMSNSAESFATKAHRLFSWLITDKYIEKYKVD